MSVSARAFDDEALCASCVVDVDEQRVRDRVIALEHGRRGSEVGHLGRRRHRRAACCCRRPAPPLRAPPAPRVLTLSSAEPSTPISAASHTESSSDDCWLLLWISSCCLTSDSRALRDWTRPWTRGSGVPLVFSVDSMRSLV